MTPRRALALGPLVWLALAAVASAAPQRPNVILIVTDDQGYGDLGCHGNPKIRTPNLDAFAKQSVELTHFHVCPVCSPTRASLLTGRYNYRTGIVDTYLGRSMMRPGEVTLADLLRDAGYRTGFSENGTWATATQCGRSTKAFRNRWFVRAAGSGNRPTRRATNTSTRSCSATARPKSAWVIAPTFSPTRR